MLEKLSRVEILIIIDVKKICTVQVSGIQNNLNLLTLNLDCIKNVHKKFELTKKTVFFKITKEQIFNLQFFFKLLIKLFNKIPHFLYKNLVNY